MGAISTSNKNQHYLLDYIKQVNESCSFSKIFTSSTVITILTLCLDYLNTLSELIQQYPISLIYTVSAGVIILLLIFAISHDFLHNFKVISANFIDFVSISGLTVGGILMLVWQFIEHSSNYKTVGALSITIFSFIVLTIRVIGYCCYRRKLESIPSDTVIFDLASIYNNSFDVKAGMPILISEKDADYDLLGRSGIINQLCKCISTYKANTSYVIGLVGEWGSGKTTILNNVKKLLTNNDEVIIIDDFDPWVFGTQDALLFSMYEKILQNSGAKFSLSQNRSFLMSLKKIMSQLSENATIIDEIISEISSNGSDYDEISYLSAEISTYLMINNKTVVFFIDNIDRAESDNIVFMFKLIGTVFNLPNIIYVLSYDKERVSEALKNTSKINPKYIEKIIQQEIYMPKIQGERIREIYMTSMVNIMRKYNISLESVDEYKPIFDYICDMVHDLRTFKRFINSVFSNVFIDSCGLSKPTLFAIESIRFLDNESYNLIKDNYQFFISEDTVYIISLFSQRFFKEEFNKRCTNFYNMLFSKKSKLQNLLKYIFPMVYLFVNNKNILDDATYSFPQIIPNDVPIYSSKFFDLYFSYGTNDSLKNINIIKELIEEIQNTDKTDQIYIKFKEALIDVNDYEQKERFDILHMHIDRIPNDKAFILFKMIWKHINQINNTSQILSLSARERSIVILTKLVSMISISILIEYSNSLQYNINKLHNIDGILYWMNSDKIQTDPCKIEIFQKLYADMCNQIISQRIDLYSDDNYSIHNIYGLIRYFEKIENGDTILSEYMTAIYKDEYVYRIIGDAVGNGVGSSGYSYFLSDNSFTNLHINDTVITDSIQKVLPRNESEYVIKEIFKKYQAKEVNHLNKYGIVTANPISFNL